MQTTYEYGQPEGVLGLVTEDFTSYRDTVIPQVAVKTGQLLTADKTAGMVRNAAKIPSSAAEIARPGVMGIVALDTTRPNGDQDWPIKRPLAAMRRGRIWVLAETAVARWTYPFVRFAGTGMAGGFRHDADGANAAQFTDGIILTDAEAGGLFLLEIDIF